MRVYACKHARLHSCIEKACVHALRKPAYVHTCICARTRIVLSFTLTRQQIPLDDHLYIYIYIYILERDVYI